MMSSRSKFAGPLDEHLGLLLSVLPILTEAADSLATKQTTIEDRSSYHYLHALCMLVRKELDRVTILAKPDTLCVLQLLDLLDGLLSPLVYLEAPDDAPHAEWYRSHRKLVTLRSQLPSKQRSRLAQLFDLSQRQQVSGVLHQLQTVYDFCRLQYPEESPIYVDEHTRPKRQRVQPAWDVWKGAQSTYHLLASVKDCACDPRHSQDARLLLATHRYQQEEDRRCLEMFLSLGYPWQEVRIGVQVHDEPSIRVIINGKPGTKPDKKNKQIKNLCKLMTQFRKFRLRTHRLSFTVEGGRLWNNSPEESSFPIDLSGGEISLEDFIRTQGHTLTEKTKRIVAVMLAHGVLHLLGTGWIQQSWGASNIIFHQISTAIPIRPYIQVNLEEHAPERNVTESDASNEDEDYFENEDLVTHPFPGLVTLGMMLMQVYMARTFHSFAKEFLAGDWDELESGPLNNNEKFTVAICAFKTYASAIGFSEQYWHAIDKCLDPHIQLDEDGEKMDQDGLRRVIYEEIVGPLEDELGQGKFTTGASRFILNLDTEARNLDLANWGQPLKFQTAFDRAAVLPKHQNPTTLGRTKREREIRATRPGQGKNGCKSDRDQRRRRALDFSQPMWLCKPSSSDFFDDESRQQDVTQQARDDFLSWKEDVLDVYDEFLISGSDTESQPTKIAVLDTGLDLEHPDFIFDLERRQRIVYQKNFTTEDTSEEKTPKSTSDDSGHGTHIAGLLLDFAPNSELYIAKIAEQDPSPSVCIAEAIRHAVDNWKVDIINMSFGFTTRDILDYNVVEDALEYANSKNVLLFAAASNNGANQRRTFPARHDYVICVHSTAADGVPSRFNAPCGTSNNFATIGEAIESSWPRNLCDKVNESCIAWKSGTSFATPIAAGIGVFLLQYADKNLDARTIKLLRKPQGMRAVFKEISCGKDGYDYIALKIHPDHLFGRQKEYVRQRMSVVLESS